MSWCFKVRLTKTESQIKQIHYFIEPTNVQMKPAVSLTSNHSATTHIFKQVLWSSWQNTQDWGNKRHFIGCTHSTSEHKVLKIYQTWNIAFCVKPDMWRRLQCIKQTLSLWNMKTRLIHLVFPKKVCFGLISFHATWAPESLWHGIMREEPVSCVSQSAHSLNNNHHHRHHLVLSFSNCARYS